MDEKEKDQVFGIRDLMIEFNVKETDIFDIVCMQFRKHNFCEDCKLQLHVSKCARGVSQDTRESVRQQLSNLAVWLHEVFPSEFKTRNDVRRYMRGLLNDSV